MTVGHDSCMALIHRFVCAWLIVRAQSVYIIVWKYNEILVFVPFWILHYIKTTSCDSCLDPFCYVCVYPNCYVSTLYVLYLYIIWLYADCASNAVYVVLFRKRSCQSVLCIFIVVRGSNFCNAYHCYCMLLYWNMFDFFNWWMPQ